MFATMGPQIVQVCRRVHFSIATSSMLVVTNRDETMDLCKSCSVSPALCKIQKRGAHATAFLNRTLFLMLCIHNAARGELPRNLTHLRDLALLGTFLSGLVRLGTISSERFFSMIHRGTCTLD